MRDRTDAIARRIQGDLLPGEEVLAAVKIQLPGTTSSQLAAATLASDGTPRFPDNPQLAEATAGAATLGVRGPHLVLTLTSGRVLLHRRSAFGRIKELGFAAPVDQIEDLRIAKQAHAVFLRLPGGQELRLETPKAFKFLPEVYARLPELFATAKRERSDART